ncbi:MAG TPA: hypothetical protein PLG63_09825 [bacterium]|nr:hypothetical protein [bacterium]HPM46405.1 hypothetical protein [bacterium]
MLTSQRVIMIGAFEKHSGKTTLSEKIIRKFSEHGIYAVKITIHRTDDPQEKYSITEDKEIRPDKDTGRLKLAGAKKVFWVRCNSNSAHIAVSEVMSMIPEDVPVLCESNMARKYMKPGIFVMVKRDVAGPVKETAAEVEKFADLITVSTMKEGVIEYIPDICNILKLEGFEWKIDLIEKSTI